MDRSPVRGLTPEIDIIRQAYYRLEHFAQVFPAGKPLFGRNARRRLLLRESIESLAEQLVHVMKTSALDSFPYTPLKLGLMDFDVHCRLPFRDYDSRSLSALKADDRLHPHGIRCCCR